MSYQHKKYKLFEGSSNDVIYRLSSIQVSWKEDMGNIFQHGLMLAMSCSIAAILDFKSTPKDQLVK